MLRKVERPERLLALDSGSIHGCLLGVLVGYAGFPDYMSLTADFRYTKYFILSLFVSVPQKMRINLSVCRAFDRLKPLVANKDLPKSYLLSMSAESSAAIDSKTRRSAQNLKSEGAARLQNVCTCVLRPRSAFTFWALGIVRFCCRWR